jgi:hypothetical protein
MEVGDMVVVTNIGREDFIEQDSRLEEFIGCTGVIIDSDDTEVGVIHHVHLDIFANIEELEEDDTYAFLETELEPSWVGWEGGVWEDEMEGIEINVAFVMEQDYLTKEEKLAFAVICAEQPCDLDVLCEDVGVSFREMGNIIDKLLDLGFIVESKTERSMFYPSYTLSADKQKKKEKEKEKTVITDTEGDLLLLMKTLEDYYKTRGVSYKISKNGKKALAKTVTYLNGIWKKIFLEPEGDGFNNKGDVYQSYIDFVFQNLDDGDLNQLKRLLHRGSRSAWRKSLTTTSRRMFIPYFYDYQWSDTHFYGVAKSEIPKDPKNSMYWTTVEIFLLNKWKTKTYPICRQVLYALETVVIHHLFRKGAVGNKDTRGLVDKHKEYIIKYRQAEMRDALDDLTEYIKQNKKASDICHNCVKKNTCLRVNEHTHVVSCMAREEA